jgi:dihydroxyacetone kinase-like protein
VAPDVSISAAVLRSALLRACDRIALQRDVLCALDAAAGDGDLGVTLVTGFGAVKVALEELPADGDSGRILTETGMQLARKAPSTIGTLLGTAFMRAGASLNGVGEIDSAQIARMLQVALDGVAERGGAKPGQRTIVDALDGSAKAAALAEAEGLSARAVLARAADGAAAAAESTSLMEPQFGRAAWVADRARGQRDAGAVAWALLLGSIADGVTESNTTEGGTT